MIDFVVTSDNESVPAPRYLRKSVREALRSKQKLKSAQKKISRRKKGFLRNAAQTKRRLKAIKQLAKKHRKVADTRKDFYHKTVTQLLLKYDVVAVKDLNIKGLAKSKLAKSLHDPGWGQFNEILPNHNW